jgi:hypothetical protein
MVFDSDAQAAAQSLEDDPWTTKEQLEALEAELNPESIVLTKATESRLPPPILVLPLLPYQKEFLAWSINQELGPIRGGILAGVLPQIVHRKECWRRQSPCNGSGTQSSTLQAKVAMSSTHTSSLL